jgi:hypothetical protein
MSTGNYWLRGGERRLLTTEGIPSEVGDAGVITEEDTGMPTSFRQCSPEEMYCQHKPACKGGRVYGRVR